jgi:uncharacterized membrane protein YkoI
MEKAITPVVGHRDALLSGCTTVLRDSQPDLRLVLDLVPMHEKTRKVLTGVAALAAAGGVSAGIATAAKQERKDGPRHAAEQALTGDARSKAEAAALEAVPGGKVLRSEEDGDGVARYEVHMTDADGKPVDVYLDADFNVVDKREGGPRPGGRGFGDHRGGPGHHGTPLTGDAKDKAEAAAKTELPDATIRESFEGAPPFVENGKYVVQVEKADGSPAAVVLDADFKVLEVLDGPPRGGPGGPGGPGMHAPPAALTGDTADKAKDAATAAVPNATVRAAFAAPEGKADGAAYVVLMERANGRHVMVLLDKDFKVLRKITEPRFGRHGGPRGGEPGPGAGFPGGPPPERRAA